MKAVAVLLFSYSAMIGVLLAMFIFQEDKLKQQKREYGIEWSIYVDRSTKFNSCVDCLFRDSNSGVVWSDEIREKCGIVPLAPEDWK